MTSKVADNILQNKTILLIISGGVAAYKSLELIRLLKKSGAQVRTILTEGGQKFITPLAVSSLSQDHCYTDLWSLKDETEMGHIRLSRETDLIVIAPATASIMAKMAHGLADDLATTCLLAADKPVMIAPAMNPMMWANPATQANIKTLQARGIQMINPDHGDMACGEEGQGRMAEPAAILNQINQFFKKSHALSQTLKGKKILITSGPTFEPIDPVRFIGNRSSGKQGYALAKASVAAGADVTYITGPTALPSPSGATTITVETADQMLRAVESALPADIAICAAAVSDYRPEAALPRKHKKAEGALTLSLAETPDILKTLCNTKNRPAFVIGFAAETDNTIKNAKVKLKAKGCDAIIANQVAAPDLPIFNSDHTTITWITEDMEDTHSAITKDDAARIILSHIINDLGL